MAVHASLSTWTGSVFLPGFLGYPTHVATCYSPRTSFALKVSYLVQLFLSGTDMYITLLFLVLSASFSELQAMSTVDQSWMSPVQKWHRMGFSFTWRPRSVPLTGSRRGPIFGFANRVGAILNSNRSQTRLVPCKDLDRSDFRTSWAIFAIFTWDQSKWFRSEACING